MRYLASLVGGISIVLIPPLAANCYAANAKAVEAAGFRTDIAILEDENCIYAVVSQFNNGNSDLYLSPDEPVFHLTGANRKSYFYQGPFVDGPQLGLNSFFKLEPGKTQEFKVLLNKHYGINKPGIYRLSLNAAYYDPVRNVVIPRGSLNLSFKYRGKCKTSP